MNIKKYMLPVLLILTAVSSALFINSCDIKSPIEGIEVRLNTFARETLVGTYFYDANTKNSISQNVKVTFTGDNASKIVDETNESKTVFTAENGILLFGVQDGTQFSQSSPFEVNVKLESNGYETKTETIRIFSKGNQSYDMFMVNPQNLPQDTDQGSSSTSNATNSSGTTTTTIQLTTGGGTSVTVPTGSTLTTSTGTPLTGTINVSVVTVPITSQNVYNAPQNITSNNNQNIAPAMSVNLNISDNSGNSASSIGGGSIEITIPFPDGIVNPRTSTNYVTGDQVTFYKQNANGFWENVGSGSVQSPLPKNSGVRGTNGVIGGTVVAGGVIIIGNDESECTSVLTITNIPDGFNKSSIRFFDAEGNRMSPSNSGSNFIFEIPEGGATIASIRINADLNNPFNTGTQLGSNIALTCGNNSASLTFPANLVGAQFDITGKCTEKDPVVTVFPSISFSYRKVGTQTWQGGSLSNGKGTITGLEVGATYDVTASYRGNTGEAQFTVTSASVIDIINFSNVLSQSVDESTSPPTLILTIDLKDECD